VGAPIHVSVAFVYFRSAVRVTSRAIYAASSHSLSPYVPSDNRCTSTFTADRSPTALRRDYTEGPSCKRVSSSILLGVDHRKLSEVEAEKEIWT